MPDCRAGTVVESIDPATGNVIGYHSVPETSVNLAPEKPRRRARRVDAVVSESPSESDDNV